MDPLEQQPASASQLPDESYIEKLFPKCQLKTVQARTSQRFRNKRTMKVAERQQQYKRQTKARQQQQQQHQHPPEQIRKEATQPGLRQSASVELQPARDKSCHLPQSATSQTIGNQNSNQPSYVSSDSSGDKPTERATNGRDQELEVAMGRSMSSQFDLQGTGDHAPEPVPKYATRHKTRKYKASKNLQQQLRRSQSSYSKLYGSQQPLPLDTADRNANGSDNDTDAKLPSANPSPPGRPGAERPSRKDQTNGNPSGKRSYLRESEAPPASVRPSGKNTNRTTRGIVFAEPIATTMRSAEPELQPQPVAVASDANTSPAPSPPSRVNGGEVVAAASFTPDPPVPVKSRRHAQHEQVSNASRTADSKPFAARTEKDEALIQVADVDVHPTGDEYPIAEPPRPAQQQLAAELPSQQGPIIETDSLETPSEEAKVDNEEDDRFINLFVYDNALPRQSNQELDRELDKSAALITSKAKQTDDTNPAGGGQRVQRPDFKPKGRHLLADADLGEDDLISNDTSIEELCSFGDADADILEAKLEKNNTRPGKREPENERIEREPATTDTTPLTNKSTLKHHRPALGVLQTVDEKGEINADEDEESSQTNCSDESRPTKLEYNELSAMNKKGLVPPGFPQRVRPAPTYVQPRAGNDCHLLQTSPTHLPPSPSSSQTSLALAASSSQQDGGGVGGGGGTSGGSANSSKITEPPRQSALPCMQLDNLTEESQSVIEKNLTDALSKVSLEAPTLRQLKIPNESSHFSAVRSPMSQVLPTARPQAADIRPSLQFNTLSEIESGPDDDQGPETRHYSSAKQAHTVPRQRQTDHTAPLVTRYAKPGSSTRLDEDVAQPVARTALVFPRLDEGLSSEAESCDDEVDDDDDKAMEADVDADDDDDEDDDDEDDDVDRSPASKRPVASNMDPFQQQPLRPQNRMLGNIQQATPGIGQSRVPDMKSQLPHPSYGDLNSQDSLNQEDLKPATNYAPQNGQPNYWLGQGMSSQQASAGSKQPGPNNVNGGGAILARTNNYVSREDAKTANRLSSDTDNETDRLLGSQRSEQLQKMAASELASNHSNEQQTATNNFAAKQGTNSREVLIEGVLFNVKYLGSTHTECEGRGEKEDRIHQAELAVHEVKFRNGESHPPVEVQLFISTEKIMVLDDKHRKIMMDHSLRTISYIADIGDAIVLIVRKKSASLDNNNDIGRPISKTSCHVFESNESHTITKSISQAFQVAYTELLKANGGSVDGGNYLPKELDYQEVLNSQEMSMTELEMFARKDNQREVIVPKKKGEILGLSIVESGWGSVLPTAVIASLKQDGPAYRCKKLSIGDQILSINGISLVGLSLAECQKILRKTKNQSVARLSVVPCPITVEVKIKRPDTKYQLGFSVQHGVICSLLRGGIAERGGVRVGHRIISINGTTVVGVPHDKIVTLLASSVGEIRMKTCLTSLYRHMLGEEKNVSFV